MSDTHAAADAATETTVPEGIVGAAVEPAADYEDRARRMGWRPKEEFRGDPNRWTDAKSFVERGENELPVLRENFRRMDEKFARTTEELVEVKKVLNEFVDFSRKGEERSYKRARSELEAKMAAAVEIADTATFNRAKAELDQLEVVKPAEQSPPPPAPPVRIDPAVQEWVGQNDWYNRDQVLKQFATAYHVDLLQRQPGLTMSENLSEVKREVIARFPDKFGNPRRDAAPAVSAPTGGTVTGTPRKKGKTYDDLPADSKVACDRYVKQINATKPKAPYTREEYVKMYFAGEE